SNADITAALKGVDIANLSVEDVIRRALSKMGG
ncbi:MAG: Holliday junction branch migration protein RuvA, partial [Clostridia bacterium]|nr:Holliday junction branch migration protein RuvA [Clostridia bacterium]